MFVHDSSQFRIALYFWLDIGGLVQSKKSLLSSIKLCKRRRPFSDYIGSEACKLYGVRYVNSGNCFAS